MRVIAALYTEQVHLVAMKPGIKSVTDLRGKRVLLGVEGLGTGVVARQILAAYRMSEHSLKPVKAESGAEAGLLENGKIDALFLVAGAPLDLVKERCQAMALIWWRSTEPAATGWSSRCRNFSRRRSPAPIPHHAGPNRGGSRLLITRDSTPPAASPMPSC